MSPYDELIGRAWDSKQGSRKVVGVREVGGKPRLLVQTGDSNQLQLLPPDELEREIKLDTSHLTRDTAPTRSDEPTFDDRGFLKTLSPMQAARAKAALLKSRTFRGELLSVAAIITQLVGSGSRVQSSAKGRRLVAQDGSYLDDKALTKVGLDFAEHLTRRNESMTKHLELQRLDEVDPISAFAALGSIAVGGAVGMQIVKAWRNIRKATAAGNKTAADHAWDKLSANDRRAIDTLLKQQRKALGEASATVGYDRIKSIIRQVEELVDDGKFAEAYELSQRGAKLGMTAHDLQSNLSSTAYETMRKWRKKETRNESAELLDEYTAEWPSALPFSSDSLTPGEDTVISWPVQRQPLKTGQRVVPHVEKDVGWLLRNHEAVRGFTVERARGDNPNLDCVVIAYTDAGATVAIGFESKALARAFIEQPVFDGKSVSWFGSQQTIGEGEWSYRGVNLDEGAVDFHAQVPTAQAGRFMEIVRAYAESHIVGNAGQVKKGVVVVNGTLSDTKGRRGNFIDGVRDRGIKGVKVGGKLIEGTDESDEREYVGQDIHDVTVPGVWVLKVWKMQRTQWGYSKENPQGGSGSASTSYKSADKLIRAQLSSVPTHMGVKPGDRVLVLVGSSKGDSTTIARAYYDTWGPSNEDVLADVPVDLGDGYTAILRTSDDCPDCAAHEAQDEDDARGTMGHMQREIDRSESTFQAANGVIVEVSPPGMKGTTKAMKKHAEIDNPFALAWWMHKRGAKSNYKADGTKKKSAANESRWVRYENALNESEDFKIEFTDRYKALGIPYPDPKTMCQGQCEGTGVVPISADETEEPYRTLWLEAEAKEHDEDGWHFIKCQDCNGTGKRIHEADEIDILRALAPHLQRARVLDEAANGVEAVEVMRVSTRPKPSREQAMSPLVSVSPDVGYATYAVYSDGTVVRDQYRDGRQTRAIVAEVEPDDIADVVAALRTIISSYAGAGTIADVQLTLSESADPFEPFGFRQNANGGLDPIIRPPHKLECLQCHEHDAYWHEAHADTGLDEFVVRCRACGADTSADDYRAVHPRTDESLVESEVARSILAQLGGRRFQSMTGAKNFVGGDRSLLFSIGRNDKGVNRVRITLGASDTYTVEFLSVRGSKVTPKSTAEDVYADNLRDVFTRHTGMETSLGTMGRTPRADESEGVAYLTGDDAERALKAIGARHPANIAAWLRKNLASLKKAGWQEGGEFEDDYESTEYKLQAGGDRYSVRLGDDFVVVLRGVQDEAADEVRAGRSEWDFQLDGGTRHEHVPDRQRVHREVNKPKPVPAKREVGEAAASPDTLSSVRKVLVQNPGRYFTVKQLAMAIGSDETFARLAASHLVTQGTAQFKRGEGFSLAGNSKVLQLPAKTVKPGGFHGQRTLGEADGYAVVRGDGDDLEYWTGEGWTRDQNEGRFYDTKDASDAEAERLAAEADETTTSASFSVLRSHPLGGQAPLPDDDDDKDADDDEEDEALVEARKKRRKKAKFSNGDAGGHGPANYRHKAGPQPKTPVNVGSVPDDEADIDEADDPETLALHKKRLTARGSPTALRRLGYSQAEVDRMLALMGSGAHKEDALYAIDKARKKSDESMGVGDTVIEVVKRKGKWYIVPPNGTAESEFTDKESAVAAAQSLAAREHYTVVVTIGEARRADEAVDDLSVDVEWQDGTYKVKMPRGWDLNSLGPNAHGKKHIEGVEEYTDIESAVARATEIAREHQWFVTVWTAKPGDNPSEIESIEIPESRVEAFSLAAQTAGLSLDTPVNYDQGRFTIDLPKPQAGRLRDLLGVC